MQSTPKQRAKVRGHEVEITTLIDTPAAAVIAGVEPKTLMKWRSEGSGPPYLKVNGYLVRYDRRQLELWLAKGAVVPGNVVA